MNNRYPHIRHYSEFEGERRLVIRDSVNITFYMRRSHREVRHAALDARGARTTVSHWQVRAPWKEQRAGGGTGAASDGGRRRGVEEGHPKCHPRPVPPTP